MQIKLLKTESIELYTANPVFAKIARLAKDQKIEAMKVMKAVAEEMNVELGLLEAKHIFEYVRDLPLSQYHECLKTGFEFEIPRVYMYDESYKTKNSKVDRFQTYALSGLCLEIAKEYGCSDNPIGIVHLLVAASRQMSCEVSYTMAELLCQAVDDWQNSASWITCPKELIVRIQIT